MVEELKKYMNTLLNRVHGLHCILISDRDGVPVVKVTSDKVPELAQRPTFLSTFALASDQGSKLGLGKNKTLICMYSQYQVIQFNKLPLVINLIASSEANTGHCLALEEYLEPILNDLKTAVIEP
ncbi:ragulator complex protein LAMTOR3-A-like [Chrysoperla carnea]|uniref:ragulator complex protein LAMTOR3-A-like n=1 Tax=Chrysoperla carnea TaxID=189513 RepID=UPI001D0632C0|nr:ragulator complex protein LAMTOR3-A-like [Chrysoperla carnea]XP_044731976.1 ragulator complex protein LAMTOR3-A-like [Chrysoperla carnea]